MIWKFRSGAQWREMPPEFGVWQTVYDRFRRWRDVGVFRLGSTCPVLVPFRGRRERLSTGQRAVNLSHARIRALGEQAMAALKQWRLLRKLRCSTTRITETVKAVLVLHLATSG